MLKNNKLLMALVVFVMSLAATHSAIASQYAYVVGDNSIATLSISPTTGQLSTVGTPMQLDGIQAIAITPNTDSLIALTFRRYRYDISYYTAASLPTYSINKSTGVLTFKADSIPLEISDTDMSSHFTLDPLGKFAYISSYRQINAYPVIRKFYTYLFDNSTGSLTSSSGINSSDGDIPSLFSSSAFDPTGNFQYLVANSSIYVGSIDQSSGTPTIVQKVGPPPEISTSARNIAMHPNGNFLYASGSNNYVFWYQVDAITGKLTPSGYIDGIDTRAIAIEPTGRFVYVANISNDTLQVYEVNQANGELTHVGDPISTGITPSHIFIDKFGRFAYVTNTGSNNIYVYSLHPTTGSMTLIQAYGLSVLNPKMLVGFSDVAPELSTTITSPPVEYSNQASGTISFSSNQNVTYQCKLDNNDFTACTSPFSYSNLAAGEHTFTLVSTNSESVSSTVSHNFTVVSNSAHTVSPTSLNSSLIPVGATGAEQSIVLSNTGASPLTITSIPETAGDFSINHSCPENLASGANCVIKVNFKPTLAGDRNATLTIIDSVGTLNVPLNGIGIIAVSDIQTNPEDVQSLVAAFDGAGIYYSINAGSSWTPASLQPNNLRVKAVSFDPTDNTVLYSATYGSGVFVSSDGGMVWSSCDNTGLENLNLHSLTVDSSGKLYAGSEGGVFVSSDGCSNWSDVNNGLPQ